MAFNLEKFYKSEIFLFAKLDCRYQQLLIVRSGVRNKIRRLKREMRTAKRGRGYDYKDYNNQVVTTDSSKIGGAKIQRKQLGRQLKEVRKLIDIQKKIFSEVFPGMVKKVAESPLTKY